MQRVAIARAIVNDPQMILADEPTGALDSENSVKIMELLKKIAKDRLVITVTHNGELAKAYATRTIKMKDGAIVSDDNPYKAPAVQKVDDSQNQTAEQSKAKQKNSFMPYSLAAKLSLKNLAGKKVRSFLTSIASSIAIIGIALVLACSNGLNAFIDKVQKDTMSSIPITVSSKEVNIAPIIDGVLGQVSSSASGENKKTDSNSIFINHTLKNITVEEITNEISQHFIDYLGGLDPDRVRYDAVKNVTRNVYKKVLMPVFEGTNKVVNVLNTMGSWACLPPERDIVEEQYTLVAGKYPENYDELLLVVDKNYSIADTQLLNYLVDIDAMDESKTSYTYDEILNDPLVRQYNLILNDDYYGVENFSESKKVDLATFIHDQYRPTTQVSTIKLGILKSNEFIASIYDNIRCYNVSPTESDENPIPLNIVGIIKLNDDTQYGMLSAPIAYTRALDEEIIRLANESAIVKAQKASPSARVLGGKTISSNKDYINVLATLGYTDLPINIKFYPKTIADKDYLLEYLDAYNVKIEEEGLDLPTITYTDHVGIVVNVVKMVVGSVSAILLALTSVSLIVSAIMIGIITYVSVIERTKEIGVLRSVGARKKDVVRLFVTETGIIGLAAGIVGVILTIILTVPLNMIMQNLTGVVGFVFLNWWNFILLIAGSALLTIISGLIPSLLASKQDPVKALRSE